MAGEIWMSRDSVDTVYAVIYDPDDSYKIYNFTTSAFEAYNAANITHYDLAMTASGDMHYGDFPDLDDGAYMVQVRLQAGASPSVDDFIIGQGRIYWSDTGSETGDSGGEIEVEDIVSSSNIKTDTFMPAIEEITPSKSRIFL
jgi:hypothetical protein